MTDDETGRALQRRVDEAGQAYSDAMVALLQHLVGLAKVDELDEHARIWGLGTANHVGGPLVVGCRDAYRSAPTPKADGVYPDHTEAEYADWVRRQWPATGVAAAATLPPSDPKPDPNAPTKPANEGLFRAIGGKK